MATEELIKVPNPDNRCFTASGIWCTHRRECATNNSPVHNCYQVIFVRPEQVQKIITWRLKK